MNATATVQEKPIKQQGFHMIDECNKKRSKPQYIVDVKWFSDRCEYTVIQVKKEGKRFAIVKECEKGTFPLTTEYGAKEFASDLMSNKYFI